MEHQLSTQSFTKVIRNLIKLFGFINLLNKNI